MASTIFMLIPLLLADIAAKDACDFLLVRNDDAIQEGKIKNRNVNFPNCSTIGFLSTELHALEQCFYFACQSDANIVHFNEKTHCYAFKCDWNSDAKNWNFNWVKSDHKGWTYAIPNRSQMHKCHNSYFVRRSWDINENVKSDCFAMTAQNVKTLNDCRKRACEDKANVFNFYPVDTTGNKCVTLHCSWNQTLKDYNFKPVLTSDTNVSIYSLSHTKKPCNSVFWNESVKIPVLTPLCKEISKFPNSIIKGDQNPEFLCNSGFNSFQIHSSTSKIATAFKCQSNEEGTGWKYYNEDVCLVKGAETQWLNLPHPGTPNCNSSMYQLRSLKEQCYMSNCETHEQIYQAKDLRQCMLYACEKNYNVINYIGGQGGSSPVCDLRNCSKTSGHSGWDYDFKFIRSRHKNNYEYDVYALQLHHFDSYIKADKTPNTVNTIGDNEKMESKLNEILQAVERSASNQIPLFLIILFIILLMAVFVLGIVGIFCLVYKAFSEDRKMRREWCKDADLCDPLLNDQRSESKN